MDVVPHKNASWGRAHDRNSFKHQMLSVLFLLFCPLCVIIANVILCEFEGSILLFLQATADGSIYRSLTAYDFQFDQSALTTYTTWVLFQAALFQYLPGKDSLGQQTPGGNILPYRTNGLQAWFVTHIVFGVLCWVGLVDAAIVPKLWTGLMYVANMAGVLLSVFVFFKAYISPSYDRDRKFSGSMVYDFQMGIEHNPRIGDTFDLKLFTIGRVGMMSWTIIDISNAAYQYQKYGSVSLSIIGVSLLHAVYVVDFFYYEDWYLRTIDIAHDHFGFYLAWGATAWMPALYTLQAQYLGQHPTSPSTAYVAVTFAAGLIGYFIFRTSNNHKDRVRSTDGRCTIWGAAPKFIRAKYTTSDGKLHESILLCSGWWGWSRHANYVGDLILSFAMCALVGTTSGIVWFYGVYMAILLIHRSYRCDQRCRAKYGKQWDEYIRTVPWRFVPGVW
ncbi:hypothetical protein MCOR25_008755 [Pyricularia grisea]|uniref:7-dehydrocholesterol reductase n=1 Tax=Pyricularia grisea TaxID=148305 RepID=A0A6P8B146_PYRGI|nr:uncharacterized protein PgNI_07152 [Pyricularia grisea]KAI6354086.1 hypothetical protein MCOR25_008755 [Pyricularia grisea]TLD08577.1 hypothetical protein PgNI_07152 [Pyricularia grisea]